MSAFFEDTESFDDGQDTIGKQLNKELSEMIDEVGSVVMLVGESDSTQLLDEVDSAAKIVAKSKVLLLQVSRTRHRLIDPELTLHAADRAASPASPTRRTYPALPGWLSRTASPSRLKWTGQASISPVRYHSTDTTPESHHPVSM